MTRYLSAVLLSVVFAGSALAAPELGTPSGASTAANVTASALDSRSLTAASKKKNKPTRLWYAVKVTYEHASSDTSNVVEEDGVTGETITSRSSSQTTKVWELTTEKPLLFHRPGNVGYHDRAPAVGTMLWYEAEGSEEDSGGKIKGTCVSAWHDEASPLPAGPGEVKLVHGPTIPDMVVYRWDEPLPRPPRKRFHDASRCTVYLNGIWQEIETPQREVPINLGGGDSGSLIVDLTGKFGKSRFRFKDVFAPESSNGSWTAERPRTGSIGPSIGTVTKTWRTTRTIWFARCRSKRSCPNPEPVRIPICKKDRGGTGICKKNKNVKTDNLDQRITDIFDEIERAWDDLALPDRPTLTSALRPTGTKGGHARGEAIDLRGKQLTDEQQDQLAKKISELAGKEYDVISEHFTDRPSTKKDETDRDHVHVEVYNGKNAFVQSETHTWNSKKGKWVRTNKTKL